MRQKLFRTSALAGVFALLASTGLAQQQPAEPQGRKDDPQAAGRMGRRHMGREGREGREGRGGQRAGRRALGRLNLSDAQREQLRAVESRYAEGFRAKREELRGITSARRGGGTVTPAQQARARQLREEIRASSDKMREEIRALLTEEQRTQLQSRRDELRGRRERLRGDRDELREQRRSERRERRREQRNDPPNN